MKHDKWGLIPCPWCIAGTCIQEASEIEGGVKTDASRCPDCGQEVGFDFKPCGNGAGRGYQ